MKKIFKKLFSKKDNTLENEMKEVNTLSSDEISIKMKEFASVLIDLVMAIKNEIEKDREYCFRITDKINEFKEEVEKQLHIESVYIFNSLPGISDPNMEKAKKSSKRILKNCLFFARKYLEYESYNHNSHNFENDIDKIIDSINERSGSYESCVIPTYIKKD